MNDTPDIPTNKRNIWIRGLFMLMLTLAYLVSGSVLCFVAVIQLLIVLLNDRPNTRLVSFGRGRGRYLKQIVDSP